MEWKDTYDILMKITKELHTTAQQGGAFCNECCEEGAEYIGECAEECGEKNRET